MASGTNSLNSPAISTSNVTDALQALFRAVIEAEIKLTKSDDGICHPYDVDIETDYYSLPMVPEKHRENILLRLTESYWVRMNAQEHFLRAAVDLMNEGQLEIEALLKPINFVTMVPEVIKVYSVLACFKRVESLDPALPSADRVDKVEHFVAPGVWLATLLARSGALNIDTVISILQGSGTLGEFNISEMNRLIKQYGDMKIETNSDMGVAKKVEQPQAFFWLPHGPKNLHEQVEGILVRWRRGLLASNDVPCDRTRENSRLVLLLDVVRAAERNGLV